MRRGLPLPDKIREAPTLEPGLTFYLQAFYELDPDRNDADGPIPRSAIARWCEEMGLDEDECDDVHYLLRRLDNAYIKHRAEQVKAGSKK